MRRSISLVAALAVVFAGIAMPADAWIGQKASVAGTAQLLLSNTGSTLDSVSNRFFPVGYTNLAASSESIWSPVSAPGRITGLIADVVTAPTGSATYTFELMQNGSATGYNCTISSSSSPAKICNNSGNSPAIAAGDYISWRVHPTNSPGNTLGSVSAVFAPTAANDTLLFASSTLSNASTQAVNPSSTFSGGTAANRRINSFPDSGQIDQLFVKSNAPGVGTSFTYTVDLKTALQALTIPIADTATAASDTNTGHAFAVTGASGATAGDDIEIQAAPVNSPAASAVAAMGLRFRPTTAGLYPLMVSQGTATSASSTLFYSMSGATNVGQATEANGQTISHAQTITKISVKLSAAPGLAASGKSYLFTLRKNGADTLCTVTVLETATANSASCSITVNDNDLLDTSSVPTGTPAAATPAISYSAHR